MSTFPLLADGLEEKGAALVLRNTVAGQAGGGGEAIVKVADEKVVDVGDEKAVVADVLVLLQADGVVHGLGGIPFGEVVLAEDEQAQAVPVAVKTIAGLGDLAFQDTAHGKSHPPIGQFIDTHILAGTEAEGVTAFQDGIAVVGGKPAREAGDVLHEGQAGGLALLHRPRDLDAHRAAGKRLEVRAVAVHERLERRPQHRGEHDLRVLFEKARAELPDMFRFVAHVTQM